MKRINLTDKQKATIKRICAQENWFHSYTLSDYAMCSNHIDQQWFRVYPDGRKEKA